MPIKNNSAFVFISFLKVDAESSQPSKQIVTEILAMADIQVNGNRPWDIQVYNDAFYNRVLAEQSLGLGESYMEGWWDSEALDETICHIIQAKLGRKS